MDCVSEWVALIDRYEALRDASIDGAAMGHRILLISLGLLAVVHVIQMAKGLWDEKKERGGIAAPKGPVISKSGALARDRIERDRIFRAHKAKYLESIGMGTEIKAEEDVYETD